MAQPTIIRVKQEEPDEAEDDFNFEMEAQPTVIDVTKLQLLDTKVASLSKFPVGCKVWYNLRRSYGTTRLLRATCSTVAAIYIDCQNLRRAYQLKNSEMIYEDRLGCAVNCSVTMTKIDADDTVEGVIVYPELEWGEGGKQKIVYAVQYSEYSDGNDGVMTTIAIEYGVAADRINCRLVSWESKFSTVDRSEEIDERKTTYAVQDEGMMQNPPRSELTNITTGHGRRVTPDDYDRPQIQQQPGIFVGGAAFHVIAADHSADRTSSYSRASNEDEPEYFGVGVTATAKGKGMKEGEVKEAMRNAALVSSEASSSQTGKNNPNNNKVGRLTSLDATRWQPPSALSQRKRSSHEHEVKDHPSKLIKTERDERCMMKSLTCILTIPSWMKQQSRKNSLHGELFTCSIIQISHVSHFSTPFLRCILLDFVDRLAKTNGCERNNVFNMERIESLTNCSIHVSVQQPMRITITSTSKAAAENFGNITQAIRMVEKSVAWFLGSETNSEKRLLYELSARRDRTNLHHITPLD